MPKSSHIPLRHEVTLTIAAMNCGPRKGERMIAVDQMLIFFACWCQNQTSLIHINPPPAAATQKRPFRIRDAMYDSKL